jgi:hypothetical protein
VTEAEREAADAAWIDALEAGGAGDDPTQAQAARIRALFRALPAEDPMAAITAKLLAAAAAAKPPAREGWWARAIAGLRALSAQPAALALASLVLVVGVAGLLVSRGKDQVARPEASRATTTPAEAPAFERKGAPEEPASGPPAALDEAAAAAAPVSVPPASTSRVGGGTAGGLGNGPGAAEPVKAARPRTSGREGKLAAPPAKPGRAATLEKEAPSPDPVLKLEADDATVIPTDAPTTPAPSNRGRDAAQVASPQPSPPPVSAPPAPRGGSAGDAPAQEQHADAAGDGELAELLASAIARAQEGDCAAARGLLAKLRARDAAYAAKASRDKRLAPCLAVKRK